MKYLVEVSPPLELANATDEKGGPGRFFQYIGERFKPEVMYGSAATRSLIMIAELATVEDVAELTFICGRGASCEPRLVPLLEAGPLMAVLQRTNGAPRLG